MTLTLSAESLPFILVFQPLFSKSVWKNAQVLLVGVMLAIGKRIITRKPAVMVMCKRDDQHSRNYHRLLNRSPWSAPKAGR